MQVPSPSSASPARQAAISIVFALRRAGYTAYLAGGCVRDEVLGLIPKDYDVATDARPEQVRRLFPRSRAVGEAFGVILVSHPQATIEVATFRTDGQYQDGRRPDHVQFTDARHDAQRRDFTINGLFGDPIQNSSVNQGNQGASSASNPGTVPLNVIDYVGGLEDLKAGVIRAIGEPDRRFAEDYLRLLRAVRFAARLDFALEPTTTVAIQLQAKNLGQISRERIGQELRWMLTGLRPQRAADLIQQLGLDGPCFLEDHRDAPLPALKHLVAREAGSFALALTAWMSDRRCPDDPPLADALRLFAHQTGPATLRRWRKALCLSNVETEEIAGMLACVEDVLEWESLSLARQKRRLAHPAWTQTMAWLTAMAAGRSNADLLRRLGLLDQRAAELLRQGVAPLPLITGADLLAEGFKPGPELGRLLEQAYDQQLEGSITTREQALAWLARQKA